MYSFYLAYCKILEAVTPQVAMTTLDIQTLMPKYHSLPQKRKIWIFAILVDSKSETGKVESGNGVSSYTEKNKSPQIGDISKGYRTNLKGFPLAKFGTVCTLK